MRAAQGRRPCRGRREESALYTDVASDGIGTTLIAYEWHPETGDVPIKSAFRILRTNWESRTENPPRSEARISSRPRSQG